MKTKAAILRAPQTDWEIVELDLDPPKENEVLIRFVAAGLCHSDEHMRTGDMPGRYPIIGGHEGAGVIEDVGPGVTRVQKSRFPTHAVYGPSRHPVLVLVTCGGPYMAGHYRDNVLVYARSA